MSKILVTILLVLTVLMTRIASAQNDEIDSLITALNSTNSDTEKVNTYNKLFELYEFSDTAKAYEFLKLAKSLGVKSGFKKGLAQTYMNLGFLFEDKSRFTEAKKFQESALQLFEELKTNPENTPISDAKKGVAKCTKNIGIINYYIGNYDTALVYMRRAFSLFNEINDKSGSAKVLMSTGIVLTSQGKYLESLTTNLKALKIFEALDDKVYTYKCLMNIGVIHLYQGNYTTAIDYFEKTRVIAENYNDKVVISNCYINMGAALTKLGKLTDAIAKYKKALQIREEIGNKAGIAAILMNIANNYYYSYDLKTALEYHAKSLALRQEIGDKEGLATVYLNMAQIKEEFKLYDEAISYLQSSMDIAKEIGSLELRKMCHENLAITYEHKGDLKNALEHHKSFKLMNDSIYNTESGKQLKEMEAKYQNEKKQKEIELKEVQLTKKDFEVKQQRTQKFAFIGGFALMIILSVVIFKSYRDKKKANVLLTEQKIVIEEKNEELSQQNEEIAAQRDEIEAQRDKLGEQNHILAEQKREITDSIYYAKRIQQAVLPNLDEMLRPKSQIPNLKSQDLLELGIWNLEFEAFILFKPKDIVSGDFYWATQINEWLIITVADCTGHGVPGAFMSMLGISFLNDIVRKKEITKAGQVLDNLRQSIIEALQQTGQSGEQKDGMDIALCAINARRDAINRVSTCNLQFAGANNPLYIVSGLQSMVFGSEPNCKQETVNHKLVEIKPDKMPVAIFEHMEPFTNHEIQLNNGDTLYLASDGFEDLFGGDHYKRFTSKRLRELLTGIAGKPMNEQKAILETTFEDWKGVHEQVDDVTILGIRI